MIIENTIFDYAKHFLSVFFIFFLLLASHIAIFPLMHRPKKSDVMIILGAAAPNGVIPGSLLASRLNHAVKLYKDGYVPFILVSGGKGPHERWPEAEVMRDYLIDRGISREIIFVENNSTSTWQNIKYSKSILEEQGFNSFLITSSGSHLARANLVARRFGLTNISYSPAYRFNRKKRDTKAFIREMVAYIVYDFFYFKDEILLSKIHSDYL